MVLNRDNLVIIPVIVLNQEYVGIFDQNTSYVYIQTETDKMHNRIVSAEADEVTWLGQTNTDAYYGRIPNIPLKAEVRVSPLQTMTYADWLDVALDIARIGINPAKGGYGYHLGMYDFTNKNNILDILAIVEHFALN
jgi:hypothetical protein